MAHAESIDDFSHFDKLPDQKQLKTGFVWVPRVGKALWSSLVWGQLTYSCCFSHIGGSGIRVWAKPEANISFKSCLY